METFRRLLARMRRSEAAWGVLAGIVLGLAAAILVGNSTDVGKTAAAGSRTSTQFTSGLAPQSGYAPDSEIVAHPSSDVRQVLAWIDAAKDAQGLPFVIVDKKEAKVFVFDSDGRPTGASPVLLGSAAGDDTVSGIGARPIEQVLPEERTTPAGRFVGERGHNARGEDVIWVDYDAAVSMHRVLTANPAERRLERISSADIHDNRISYGCINVPAEFFETRLRPAFSGGHAVIYVLPEIKSLEAVFDLQKTVAGHAPEIASDKGMPLTSQVNLHYATSGSIGWPMERVFSDGPNAASRLRLF